MGLLKYGGERRKLWENSWKGNLFVRSVMSHARFEQILKAWHSTDYADYTAEEIKNLKAADPFWPVAELERELNVTFSTMMKPGQFPPSLTASFGIKQPSQEKQLPIISSEIDWWMKWSSPYSIRNSLKPDISRKRA